MPLACDMKAAATPNYRKWLRLGMYVGPFVFAAVYLLCWAAVGWVRSPAVAYGLVGFSLVPGTACAVFYKKPSGAGWLFLFPYLFVYGFLVYVFALVLAIYLGAPK
jgi:hypothetical protein